MNRNQFWLFAICIISFATFFGACNKNSTSTTEGSTSGNWITRSEFDGSVRTKAVVFVINDTAYVGTGFNGTSNLSDFYKFSIDGADGSWKRIADMPGSPRNSAIAFSVNGKGYVASGIDANQEFVKDVYEYNPATNEWTKKADLPAELLRQDAVGFGIGSYGYITSGFNNSYLKDFWKYNPTNDTWSNTNLSAFSGAKRRGAVGFVYNNSAYVVTGFNNGQGVSDFFKFTPDANGDGGWAKLKSITNLPDSTYNSDYTDIIRQNAVAFTVGTESTAKAYISTGSTSGGYTSKTWEYDFQKDQWTRKTDFESSFRDGAIGFTLKNRGFAGLGRSSTLYFDNLFEFVPNQTKIDYD